ncbi:MAG: hypothetical protein XD76_0209 [candidate division TA06 bacterium 32_111]|uniref:Uncharacterized protein n=2 Tax=Bacteria candidate phyla TaxID=1783234 RepID=A0A117M6D7_UNCT6|nr:MAG: hypothetical protein XD76_0209 [candidate division TA06 bacterium 32_111]KUK86832.1 MAG: hypothetical protein XE03_1195 [candidate division TA06 bacterium 34_109]HAF07329.1 hypothetical protein [candidate division WOR-3 bacterium]HCP16437.1 hypothetical protein [candidate division WOR-3 bacterium]
MKNFVKNFFKEIFTNVYNTLEMMGIFKYFDLLFFKSKKEKMDFFKGYYKRNKILLLVFLSLLLLVIVVFEFNLNKPIAAILILIVGMVTHIFTELLALLALIPVFGPIIVKIISLPFIILLNAITYLVSFFALKRGYKVEMLKSRSFTTTLLFGILIGYILGKII